MNIASPNASVHHVFLGNSNTKSTRLKCLFGILLLINICHLGFPCGSAGKESASNAGDLGSIPGLGIPMERGKATPPIFWSGEFHGVTKSQT